MTRPIFGSPTWVPSPDFDALPSMYGALNPPALELLFTQQVYRKAGTNYALANYPGYSFSRASTGTALTSSGTIVSFGSGVPRITDLGLLIEQAATNLFLNSFAPVTQTITLSATGNYTLSVWGTGSVAVAAGTATITGAGSASSGAAKTINCTVTGTVTLTVTGSPTAVNFEAGAFGTSPILTLGSTATRAADIASVSGLSAQAAATWFGEFQPNVLTSSARVVGSTGTPNFSTPINLSAGAAQVYDAGALATTANTMAVGTIGRAAMSYSATGTSVVLNGGAVATGAAPANLGSLTTFVFGGDPTGSPGPQLNGYVRRVYQRSGAITGAQLQALTQ